MSKMPLRQMILENWSSEDFPRAAIVVLKKGDKFLSVSRKDDPNAVGFPGGKVDVGETDEEAARRELFEETGLTAGTLKFLYAGKSSNEKYWVTTYFGDYEGEIHTEEAGVVQWLPKEAFLTGPFAVYNTRLFSTLGLI